MKSSILIIIAVLLITSCLKAQQKNKSLVQLNFEDFNDTKIVMKIVEIERNVNTSKLKLSYEKMGTSVESSMFIMRGFCEVAKARGVKYFINLKEWEHTDGERIYIGGFTNIIDPNIHDEFGKEFISTNEYGQSRRYMSVSQCNLFWKNQ